MKLQSRRVDENVMAVTMNAEYGENKAFEKKWI